MNQQWITTLLTDGQNGRVLLSDEMLASINVQIGDDVEVTVRDGGITITPLKKT